MSETVMSTSSLPSFLVTVLNTDTVKVSENNRVVTIVPADDNDCTAGFRGMFAGDPNMTVDSFLQRKREDTRLDL